MSSETLDQIETQSVPLQLPVQVPRQTYRRAQSNIPDDKQVRVRLKQLTEDQPSSPAVSGVQMLV